MQSKVKLTKRQIKEDKFTTLVLTAKDQVAENWQFAVIGAVVVILIIAGIFYYINAQRTAVDEAGEKFARAMLDYRNGDLQIAILGLNQVIEDYSSDEVAEEATFMLGKLNLRNRNYAEATRYFQMYLDKFKSNRLNRAAALAGLAVCHENQGEFAEAAAKFDSATQEYPDGPLEGDYLLGALRNYVALGDTAAAGQRLATIEDKYYGSAWLSQAQLLFYEKGLIPSQP